MVSTYGDVKLESHEDRADRDVERVQTLARVLDHHLVDPLIGLVAPGVGDLIGSLIGFYTVMVAARRKVSPVVIARMLMNLAGDALLGVIPVLGDIGDFAFKANKRNAELLASAEARGGRASAKDWAMVAGAAIAWIAAIGLVIYGFVRLFRALDW